MIGHGWFFDGGIVWMLIVGAIVVIPFWKLLPQYGIPAWVALFAVFPFAAVLLLWVMAFRERSIGG